MSPKKRLLNSLNSVPTSKEVEMVGRMFGFTWVDGSDIVGWPWNLVLTEYTGVTE